MKRIILGLNQHDYQKVIKMGLESFGLSQSIKCKAILKESIKALAEFEKRNLGLSNFVALIIGKNICPNKTQ